eukprot:TRINITY_DN18968_c0_g2_i15.p4 TRINITY_DN18968_c0_g2~~TRINITY_DN18968_c0_g2_i15.p4  ORF type:complete len:101 (-),score=0.35 TRINITY_DN18968_c0_g2_i15:372-674(-)
MLLIVPGFIIGYTLEIVFSLFGKCLENGKLKCTVKNQTVFDVTIQGNLVEVFQNVVFSSEQMKMNKIRNEINLLQTFTSHITISTILSVYKFCFQNKLQM